MNFNTIIYIATLCALTACAPDRTPPKVKIDYTKGLYEPFATDEILPYQPKKDNDANYYYLFGGLE